jgi:integration host factor subunit beta
MTKSQLIERIAERAPRVPRREVERIVNTVFDSMVEALRRAERIEIRGFGSFAVKIRHAREGRNPRTGERVRVPRRLTPYFTPGKELRDRLNAMAAPDERDADSAGGTSGDGVGDGAARERQQLLIG